MKEKHIKLSRKRYLPIYIVLLIYITIEFASTLDISRITGTLIGGMLVFFVMEVMVIKSVTISSETVSMVKGLKEIEIAKEDLMQIEIKNTRIVFVKKSGVKRVLANSYWIRNEYEEIIKILNGMGYPMVKG